MTKLSHIDSRGHAQMVDVTEKEITKRVAIATGVINMQRGTVSAVMTGAIPKGDVLAVARVAGIMAAKKTPELVPLCHALLISSVTINFAPDLEACTITINAEVKVSGRTGVEMEALTATSVAALTIYDMCKAIDKTMVISGITLVHKSGGRTGTYDKAQEY